MPRKPRLAHVECADAAGYRWLKLAVRGATLTADGNGFLVTDEAKWAECLQAAGGTERLGVQVIGPPIRRPIGRRPH